MALVTALITRVIKSNNLLEHVTLEEQVTSAYKTLGKKLTQTKIVVFKF